MLNETDRVGAGISEDNPLGYDFDPDSAQYEDLTEEQKAMVRCLSSIIQFSYLF